MPTKRAILQILKILYVKLKTAIFHSNINFRIFKKENSAAKNINLDIKSGETARNYRQYRKFKVKPCTAYLRLYDTTDGEVIVSDRSNKRNMILVICVTGVAMVLQKNVFVLRNNQRKLALG